MGDSLEYWGRGLFNPFLNYSGTSEILVYFDAYSDSSTTHRALHIAHMLALYVVLGREAVNILSPEGGRLTMYLLITTAQCNAEVETPNCFGYKQSGAEIYSVKGRRQRSRQRRNRKAERRRVRDAYRHDVIYTNSNHKLVETLLDDYSRH